MMEVLRACFIFLVCYAQVGDAVKFEEVIRVLEQKRLELSTHKFFSFLKDESIPVSRRMTFVPYWTFYAMSFADILDNWLRIPNPKNEMEQLVNTYVEEDNFHYNFFLHDVESVLGYTLERYGSYEAVVRHIWGDDSKTVRQFVYTWASLAKRYDDPIVVLASFEAAEAGLKDIFEVAYEHVYMQGREGGLKDLQYFGKTHVELEMNHTMTSWFAEGEQPHRPLAEYDISQETKEQSVAVVEEMMERYAALVFSAYLNE